MGETAASDLARWGEEARTAFAPARDPARLEAAVVRFHRTVDAAIAATVVGHGVRVECSRGCSACCHLRVEVQPQEAFTLAAWLRRRLAPAALEAVVERLRANVERTEAIGAEARKRTNLACALLASDGTCTAYEARPAQCRRYHSLRVATCNAFHADPTNETLASPMHPAVAHNAAVIITQAQHAVRAAGLDAQNEDLNQALLAALDQPKAWRRWKDGKKPFVRAAG